MPRRGRQGARTLCGLAGALAEALTAIHAARVARRDLKPSYAVLTHGSPRTARMTLRRLRPASPGTAAGAATACLWGALPIASAQGTALHSCPRSWSRWGRGDSADLPEQAQGVPVAPFFNELAVNDPAEQLSVYVDRLTGGSGTL